MTDTCETCSAYEHVTSHCPELNQRRGAKNEACTFYTSKRHEESRREQDTAFVQLALRYAPEGHALLFVGDEAVGLISRVEFANGAPRHELDVILTSDEATSVIIDALLGKAV